MEKIVNKYETIFVVDTSIGEENVTAVVEKFKAMIERQEAKSLLRTGAREDLHIPSRTEQRVITLLSISQPNPSSLKSWIEFTTSLTVF